MRALVPLLIVLGLLLPRGGAALGEALGTERVVICRGDAIVVVVLGADGAPVETLPHDAPLCLATPAPPSGGPAVGPPAVLVPSAVPVLRPRPAPVRGAWHGPPPLRAPPVV